ncbi:ribonuclease III [Adhaeribacter radiodurans]|nr:ribonuclease III [Adhaeribacter radiodurans]
MLQLFRKIFRQGQNLERSIHNVTGVSPGNMRLYHLALTHTSFGKPQSNERHQTNERLEFLGDSILGAVIADFLYKKFPYKDEGFLTEIRSRIVNRESLNHIALKIGINTLVKVDQASHSARYKSINGNALEALVGAIYLDKGYKQTKYFILEKLIKPHFDLNELVSTTKNFKSKLIEWAQAQNKIVKFDIINQKQSGSTTEFTSEVTIDSQRIATGIGYSKKKAEQAAAEKALLVLQVP